MQVGDVFRWRGVVGRVVKVWSVPERKVLNRMPGDPARFLVDFGVDAGGVRRWFRLREWFPEERVR